MSKNTLKLTAAVLALGIIPMTVQAETVTTQTYIQTKDQPNVNEIDFTVFDTNHDGIYSMKEVGERLFHSFDRDNNDLIDNNEWGQKTVLTIIPVEKDTFKFIDYNDDGLTDKSVYTYETFYKTSGLSRFDNNKDGLSAADFVNTTLLEMDEDGNKLISLPEWEKAYKTSREKVQNQHDYN